MSENQRDDELQARVDAEIAQAPPDELSENKLRPDDEAMLDLRQNTRESSDSAGLASSDQSVDNPTETKAAASPGELLRDERIRQGLSLAEVARRLCLSERQVSSIESQSYAELPSPTPVFLRGYVRNYARILRLANVDQLLQMLPHNLPTQEHAHAQAHADSGLVRRMQPIKPLSSYGHDGGGGKWLYALLIIGVLLTGYLFFQSDKLDQQASALLGDVDLPSLPGNDVVDGQAKIELPLPATSPSLSTGTPFALPPVTQPDQVKEALAGTKPSTGQSDKSATTTAEEHEATKSLHFVFSRDSWVKVKDSEGKVILEKIHARGSEHTISGKPPLYLVIGNAAGVTLTYDGRKVDLAPYTRGNDDVARFSLE